MHTEGDEGVFNIGDRVMYGIHGLCQIVEITYRSVDRNKIEYYVLEPVDHSGAQYFVPTRNQVAVSKLRPVLTKDALNELLLSDDVRSYPWIEDENTRKQRYRELITGGDTAALLGMVHTLHNHKSEQIAAGRKFHLCDENFLRDAEKVLTSEFSLVLDLDSEDVAAYIKKCWNII